MIHYPAEWMASDTENDPSGVAQYWVNGRDYVLQLRSFEDFQTISEMLSRADDAGRDWMRSRASELMDGALQRVRSA